MVSFRKAVVALLFLQTVSLVLGCYDTSIQGRRLAEQVHWDYSDGHRGPAHWHELTPQWSVCKTGHHQSPIHITSDDMVTDKTLGKLKARYKAKTNATIANDGHAVVVDLSPKSGVLKINGVTYRPAQFHLHMPSEHRVMNQSFPLEMHLVHKSEHGKLAVISFLFVEGEESEFLAQFADKLPSYKEAHVKYNIGKIKLLKPDHNYGRYIGSLTTPPCAENVAWTVMLWNYPTVSTQQLKLIRDSVPHTNNRPTFPSHGRNVHTSVPAFK